MPRRAGRGRWAATLLAAAVLGCGASTAAPVRAAAPDPIPQIWMSATEPVWRQAHGWPANDYMELFRPSSPWRYAAQHVEVFQVSKRFVEQAGDGALAEVISSLARRGIALAMQGTPNVPTAECGRGIESYGPPEDMARDAARIRRLGGTLAYIDMDEPLFYGHVFNGRRGTTPCHAPLAVIAASAARKIAAARRIFPSVQVGEAEPFGIPFMSAGGWASLLGRWFDAFAAASGMRLAFVHADIVWRRPNALAQFEAALPMLRAAGIPLGVIYDGSPFAPTSAAWVAEAKQHVQLIEARLGIVPAQAVFQTWMERPMEMLPDTASDTLTGLIAFYVASHSSR